MLYILLLVAIVIIVCILCNKLSNRLGIPMLLAFIILGMIFGSDGIFKIPFDNYSFAEQICSIALIFIMFYGGFGTKWNEAKPIACRAILLSSIGVVITAFITGLFCYYILNIDFLESLLIGSVISSTDAASVFSILRSKRLNLKYNTASLLEVESGSNDPCSYMLTVIILSIMKGTASVKTISFMILSQVLIAIVLSVIIAVVSLWILTHFHFVTSGFDTIFVVAVAILSYTVPSLLGGNGYLSVYIVGIILGNHSIKNKQPLVHFFDGVTGLMQMLIFFLLGLLSFPSQLPKILLPSLLIAVFLTFVARPLSVFMILSPFRCKVNQQLLVSWAGLRGAASIVFSITATISTAQTNQDIFHIVFGIVLFSILLQGSLIPLAAKKLDMLDEESDVLKTFNDYTDEVPVQFIQFSICKNHPWIGKSLKDIILPPETLVVLLQRGTEQITPNGNTVLEEDDALILSAKALETIKGIRITEFALGRKHEWIGKPISEIELEPDKLIIMIERGNQIIIPRGMTTLEPMDTLILNEID